MADEKPTGAWGSSAVVLAFAAVSAGYVAWQQPTLVSSRPPNDAEYQGHVIKAPQDINARLWQDPFAAVARDVDEAGDRAPKPGNYSLTNKDQNAGGDQVLTIVVTLPGAPYPEVAETRRRLRYAVLAALHTRNFMPEDEKHIGYLRTDKLPFAIKKPTSSVQAFVADLSGHPTDGDTEARIVGATFRQTALGDADTQGSDAPLPKTIPFERFEEIADADGAVPRHVQLLWLDEDFLTSARTPISSLTRLQGVLEQSGSSRFTVLGPENSTTLAAMVREMRGSKFCNVPKACSSSKSCIGSFSIYNFGATAKEEMVTGSSQLNLAQSFSDAGLRYYRTVNTDGKLAEALACELMRRDANLDLKFHPENCSDLPLRQSPSNHVVLISDWDTVYGQDLAQTVQERFEIKNKINWSDPPLVTTFSYLRGLDGRLPIPRRAWEKASFQDGEDLEQKLGEQAGEKPPSVATPENANRFESAEGQSQFDYLRRLAADLKERDARYRRKGEGHIAAIGVLGSDVYDKLLILQALRPELPEALFFTTDLDELLLPQKKARYTRDLLVASSFDLRLNDRLQRDIPPFRNTYQTSIFLAAQLAIQNELGGATSASPPDRPNAAAQKVAYRAPAGATCEPANAAAGTDESAGRHEIPASWLAEPLLFQIGRTAAEPLQPRDEDEDTSCGPGNIFNCRSIQPSAEKLYPVLGTGARVSAAGILTILLLGFGFSMPRIRSRCFPQLKHGDGVTRSVNPRIGLLLGALTSATIVSSAFWWKWPIIADYLTGYESGEPMTLLEGISLWPSILLRFLGVLLALWLVCCTFRNLDGKLRETEGEMSLPHCEETLCEEGMRILGNKEAYPTPASCIMALLWFSSPSREEGERRRVQLEKLRGGFASRSPARGIRALIATLMMLALGWILLGLFGPPNIPGRGSLAPGVFRWITLFEVFVTIFLIFLVADATLVSRAFIKRLTAVETIWPGTTLSIFQGRFHLSGADLADWIDMNYLARRTRSITRIIYFPFIALAVLVVSRSSLFDDFATAWTIVITQALSAAIVIGSAIALRLTAEKARKVACDHITAHIIAAKDDKANRLEKLLDEVKNLSDGAFAPWTSQPVVGAVLLPLITYGGTWLLHLYALPGM